MFDTNVNNKVHIHIMNNCNPTTLNNQVIHQVRPVGEPIPEHATKHIEGKVSSILELTLIEGRTILISVSNLWLLHWGFLGTTQIFKGF